VLYGRAKVHANVYTHLPHGTQEPPIEGGHVRYALHMQEVQQLGISWGSSQSEAISMQTNDRMGKIIKLKQSPFPGAFPRGRIKATILEICHQWRLSMELGQRDSR